LVSSQVLVVIAKIAASVTLQRVALATFLDAAASVDYQCITRRDGPHTIRQAKMNMDEVCNSVVQHAFAKLQVRQCESLHRPSSVLCELGKNDILIYNLLGIADVSRGYRICHGNAL
jgi:hypothetical protein